MTIQKNQKLLIQPDNITFLLSKFIEIEEENYNTELKSKDSKYIMKYLDLMILHKIEKGSLKLKS